MGTGSGTVGGAATITASRDSEETEKVSVSSSEIWQGRATVRSNIEQSLFLAQGLLRAARTDDGGGTVNR